MIFRLSQKLNTRIKAGTLTARPLDGKPYADWSAHLFSVQRTQYILIANTPSLYSTVLFARGITSEGAFIDHALGSMREFMADDGQQFAFHRFIAPASKTVSFAKALNRTVTGSMNELIMYAKLWLGEEGDSPHEVGFKLNDNLFTALGTPENSGYGRPREAFKALVVPG